MWTEKHIKEKAVEYGSQTDASAHILWTSKRRIAEKAFYEGAMYILNNTQKYSKTNRNEEEATGFEEW